MRAPGHRRRGDCAADVSWPLANRGGPAHGQDIFPFLADREQENRHADL
jgi:hypothetical protein